MTPKRAYLDYNASAPLRPSALASMQSALSCTGNASSVHGEGRDLRRMIESARRDVAALVGSDSSSVTFTSSATEAAHLALCPDISCNGSTIAASRLYVLETEHPCVLAGGRFEPDQIISIPVDGDGVIDHAAFKKLMDDHDGNEGVPFVAIQLANSETGVIQPVKEIAQAVRFKGGYTLCDAVQAAGRIPISTADLGVDFLILSAHKIGGPHGAGALVNAHSILDFPPAIRGGGQEKNRRAGTENVAAIAGFGAAAKEALKEVDNYSQLSTLRDSIEVQLLPICAANGMAEQVQIFGGQANRLANTLLFGVAGLKAETALIALDLDGVAVSSGSACSSGKVGASHVLQAMKVDETLAKGAIRVSLGWNSTEDDVNKFIAAFEKIVKRLGEQTETRISGAA